jgi:glycosyltransferase involved in cell wall biosynthesis
MQSDGHISSESQILFCDDGSNDKTWEIIQNLHTQEPYIHGIKLAHNRGHQNVLYAGLMAALGDKCDAAISMDADLQDDISCLDEFVKEYRRGVDIVYGVRSSRERDTFFKRATAHGFYSFMKKMGAETVADHADYRLMSARALEALSEYTEVNLFLRGIVPSIGLRTAVVKYERGERVAGESKYPLKKMLSFAIEGITSFSVRPLGLITIFGMISVLVGIGMFVYAIVSAFGIHAAAGWASIMCSLWLLGGMAMLSIGILGEYIGKIYMESKRRPRYYIEEKI